MPEVVAYIVGGDLFNNSRATKEIVALCDAGHKVIAMSWNRVDSTGERSRRVFEGYPVEFRFFDLPVNGSLGFRNITKLAAWLRWVRRCLRAEPDVTVVHACDLDSAAGILHIVRKRKLKFVYDIYDYYVDSHSIPFPLSPVVESLEIKAINRADLTIICTEERKQQIRKANPKKLLVIHNSPDVPVCPENMQPEFDYVYCGAMFSGRLLSEIFDAYPKNSDLRIAIAGHGDFVSQAQKLDAEFPNFTYLGSLPYKQVLETEMKAAVISAIYDPSVRNHRLCAPNKFYEALALSKPVIVCAGTGIDKIVEHNQIGAVINYDAEQFYRELRILISKREACTAMGQRARKLYEEKYQWKIMGKRLQDAYAEL